MTSLSSRRIHITMRTKNEPKTKTQTVRDVPVDLWRAFKAKAASRGETIRAAILRLLAEYAK